MSTKFEVPPARDLRALRRDGFTVERIADYYSVSSTTAKRWLRARRVFRPRSVRPQAEMLYAKLASGKTIDEVAYDFNVKPSTARRWCDDLGLRRITYRDIASATSDLADFALSRGLQFRMRDGVPQVGKVYGRNFVPVHI